MISDGQSIRVMTYNIHKCLGRDRQHQPERIRDVIQLWKPDIVALQEVDVRFKVQDGIHQPEYFTEQLGMHSHFQPAIVDGDRMYGNMLLSRFPFRVISHQTLPDTPMNKRIKIYEKILSSTYEPRSALWAEIESNGQPVQIFITHFGLSKAERLQQLEKMLAVDWMESGQITKCPKLLLGDLNDSPGSKLHRRLCQKLKDVQAECVGHKRKRTFWSWRPLRCLDHVFVSHHWNIESVDVPRTPLTQMASDHLPIIAQLTLQNK